MNGVLEFIDTSDFTTMGLGEHFMCTDVEWDPTGRYVQYSTVQYITGELNQNFTKKNSGKV